ncbi:MAG: hypothetical protein BZY82_07950 [SAR202 cluster bacterium Io17-Chloro-G3]|nr:MAG: hypothetical protein BZY82_07950 [SAR202 cluster bacterium Io17-Chloro-G3]
MAKLGTYSYPDIRFADAVEISGRIATKFKGIVSVKGLAWELGMAENSGTLFAKVAALRDFGLVEGRGELRVSALAQRILHPATQEEGKAAKAQAFQRVDLLQSLYERFNGETPDDSTLLVALEEVTRAPRDEIVRRFSLIQKHLADAARVLGQPFLDPSVERSSPGRQYISPVTTEPRGVKAESPEPFAGLYLAADDIRLSVPLSQKYIEVAINLLQALKIRMYDAKDVEPVAKTAQKRDDA